MEMLMSLFEKASFFLWYTHYELTYITIWKSPKKLSNCSRYFTQTWFKLCFYLKTRHIVHNAMQWGCCLACCHYLRKLPIRGGDPGGSHQIPRMCATHKNISSNRGVQCICLLLARSFDDILLNATGQHSHSAPCHMHVHVATKVIYHKHAIISRGLYIFYPISKDHFFVFKEVFFRKFCPYVWLVFKSGF